MKYLLSAVMLLVFSCASHPTAPVEEKKDGEVAAQAAASSPEVQEFDRQLAEIAEKISGLQAEATKAETEKTNVSAGSLRREIAALESKRDYVRSRRNHALLNANTAK